MSRFLEEMYHDIHDSYEVKMEAENRANVVEINSKAVQTGEFEGLGERIRMNAE